MFAPLTSRAPLPLLHTLLARQQRQELFPRPEPSPPQFRPLVLTSAASPSHPYPCPLPTPGMRLPSRSPTARLRLTALVCRASATLARRCVCGRRPLASLASGRPRPSTPLATSRWSARLAARRLLRSTPSGRVARCVATRCTRGVLREFASRNAHLNPLFDGTCALRRARPYRSAKLYLAELHDNRNAYRMPRVECVTYSANGEYTAT